MKRELIIFTDSGDTLVDEGSEHRREGSEIVECAEMIEGAKDALLRLKEEGFLVGLVADGLRKSFENVYRQHGLTDIFDAWTISEEVGEEKPSGKMFRAAMESLGLTDADRHRIIMVGNNLKRDIVGANRFGITSVLLSWSPRYCMTPKTPEEVPDHVIQSPDELLGLALRLDEKLQNGRAEAGARTGKGEPF